MTKRTALHFIANEAWAIRPDALETICAVAEREHEFAGNIEALEQKLGRPLGNTHAVSVRDGVAMVPVSGPLFRYANMFTQISGATAYSTLATDLRTAVDDPTVQAIALVLDSPGGEVRGLNELAKQVAAIRGVKPIVAYVGGQACSAAYWLASACDEIVADEMALVGSIGAMLNVKVTDGKPGERSYSFVSSMSPNKNAGPETEAGASQLQQLVDDMGHAFVEAVAKNRGVTVEDVLAKYGQGATFTGREALARGMVDSAGTLEGLIARLSESSKSAAMRGKFMGATAMTPQEQAAAFAAENAEAAALLRAEGSAAERDHILAVRAQALAGHEDLIEALAFDGKTTGPEAAVAILAAERARVEAAGNARFADAQPPVAAAPAEQDQQPAAADTRHSSGLPVNADRAQLDAAAKAYAAEHGCDYLTAVKAVSKDN